MTRNLEIRIPLLYLALGLLTWVALAVWSWIEPNGDTSAEQFSIALSGVIRVAHATMIYLAILLVSSGIGFFLSKKEAQKSGFALSFLLGIALTAFLFLISR